MFSQVSVDTTFPIHYVVISVKRNWSLLISKILTLFSCNTELWSQDVSSKSFNHGTNNVLATNHSSLPKTASNANTPLPTKSSTDPNSSSTITNVLKSDISRSVSTVSLPSSHKADDTSELSGLYHLISFKEVDKSGRQASYFTTPSLTVSHHNETHSRHRDLATMLAELVEPSSSRSTSSTSSRTPKASSTISSGTLRSESLRNQGKAHDSNFDMADKA